MMKKYILVFFLFFLAVSCKKRNNKFYFAGAWEIQKVEQVRYINDQKTLDSLIENDTVGWFAFQNANGFNGQGKIKINFVSISGLKTDFYTFWAIDENNGDRLEINDQFFTRTRISGGEKWTWITESNSGASYTRETIYVKRK